MKGGGKSKSRRSASLSMNAMRSINHAGSSDDEDDDDEDISGLLQPDLLTVNS